MLRSSSSATGRLAWVDVTKGICIVLVVLFHSTLVDATPPDTGPWWVINAVFATLRMPLFFLASGLFAASVLQQPWKQLLRGRVLLLVHVFVLWLTMRQAYFALLSGELDLTWQDYALPDSDMWFLYVLAVFFLVGRALTRCRPGAALAAAAVVSAMASSLAASRDFHRFDDMAVYFVFFLAGCHGSAAIRRGAAHVTAMQAVGACGVFLALSVTVAAGELRAVPPFRFVLTVAALAAGLSIAVVLDRSRLGPCLAFVGQRSLPIYLLHMLPVRTIVHLAGMAGWDVQAQLLGPPLLTTAGVAGSLWAHSLLRGVPGLFESPKWLQSAVGGPQRATSVVGARPARRRTDVRVTAAPGPRVHSSKRHAFRHAGPAPGRTSRGR